jgi:hypothetical protein
VNKKIYIFVHIPRTSGTFLKSQTEKSINDIPNIIFCPKWLKIDSFLTNFKEQHPTIFILKKMISPKNYDKVQFFTIVRNPYDRLYSMWKYFVDREDIYKQMYLNYKPETFEKFIEEYCEGYYDGHYIFQSQLYFLKGEQLDKIKIIKFEDREEINNFLIYNKVQTSEIIINASPKVIPENYIDAYTKDMKDMVYKKLKEEFDLLNYGR